MLIFKTFRRSFQKAKPRFNSPFFHDNQSPNIPGMICNYGNKRLKTRSN